MTHDSWTTRSELNFVSKIGTFCEQLTSKSREERLESYLKASRLRVNWGTINKEAVLRYVKNELGIEEQKSEDTSSTSLVSIPSNRVKSSESIK